MRRISLRSTMLGMVSARLLQRNIGPKLMTPEESKQAERDLIRDYQKLFATPEGKRVEASISQVCGYDADFTTLVAQGSQHEIGFALGMRHVAWYIKSQLVRDPDAVQPEETENQEQILS